MLRNRRKWKSEEKGKLRHENRERKLPKAAQGLRSCRRSNFPVLRLRSLDSAIAPRSGWIPSLWTWSYTEGRGRPCEGMAVHLCSYRAVLLLSRSDHARKKKTRSIPTPRRCRHLL